MDGVETLASSFRQNQTITIELERGECFAVQKALLSDTSKTFADALRVKREHRSDTLKLYGCDEDTFKLFLYWLCKKTLPNFNDDIQRERENEKGKLCRIYSLLVRLWEFGRAYAIRKLQSATRECICGLMDDYATPLDVVRDVYATASFESAKLRTLFIDTAMYEICQTPKSEISRDELEKFAEIPLLVADFIMRARDCIKDKMDHERSSSGESTDMSRQDWLWKSGW